MGKFLVPLVTLIILSGCTSNSAKYDVTEKKAASTDRLIFHLGNDDITWTTTTYGLRPSVTGDVAKKVEQRMAKANSNLLHALRNKNKFAAAHVLLTRINLKNYHKITVTSWNRMTVKIDPNTEAVEYDESQIPDLIEFWDKVLELKAVEAAKKGM